MRDNAAKRVLIADDEYYSIESLKLTLAHREGILICGQAGNGEELIQLSTELEPDVIITDIRMPGINTADAIGIIRAVHPDIKILAWTQYVDDEQILNIMNAGANGYLFKNAEADTIVAAIESVTRDQTFFCETTNGRLLYMIQHNYLASPYKLLPPHFFAAHEREILVLICKQYKSRQIAVLLGLTNNTVNKYRNNLLLKTGAENMVGLVMFALEHGIVKKEDIPRKKH
ncbi:MAG: response regulator transcription factor [Niabella sp.]